MRSGRGGSCRFQYLAGPGSGVGTCPDNLLARYENMVDALRREQWAGECGLIGHGPGVEHHEIGYVAGGQPASFRDVEPLRGVRGHSPDHLVQVGAAFVSHVPADRKSTRLNSSHVAIPYAVCCLENI